MNTAHFKEQLETEKKKLEHELASLGKKNPQVPGEYEAVGSEQGSASDLVDQADTIKSCEENEGVLHDLEIRYEHVRSALTRIENGSYGKCSVCGGQIEHDRLEADPAATTCKSHLS